MKIFDVDKVILGKLTSSHSQNMESRIMQIKMRDEDIKRMEEVALNANEKFIKTRKPASGVSVFRSKNIPKLYIHPLFIETKAVEEEFKNMISDFKPK